MLARHAESLFWTGRYIERAEDTARMLDVTYHGLLESPPRGGRSGRGSTCSSVLHLDQRVRRASTTDATAGTVSEFLVLDDDEPRRDRARRRPGARERPRASAS